MSKPYDLLSDLRDYLDTCTSSLAILKSAKIVNDHLELTVKYLGEMVAKEEARLAEAESENPCANCGVSRTKAEGGTVFTLCDKCWDKSVLAGDRP